VKQFRLDGKWALVTGGGRGIGQAVAFGLATLGASVIVADILGENAQETAETIRGDGGVAQSRQVDISRVNELQQLFSDVDAMTPTLDILVCAAGVLRRNPLLDHNESDWDYMMNVNVKGTFFALQEAARRMVPHRSGSIVTFSSTSGFVASRSPQIAYDVTKGAIRQMTISAAAELAPHGVRVNGIAPGTILTDFNRAWMDTPEKIKVVEERLPMGRVGLPDDVVGGVLFLCSPLSEYVTGHVLAIDGGRLSRHG
jgi:NAD(P)-dependent dehydrogenase (short-subunit alcohol dehydrogenase family)